jgi:beta-phosphoglucomutase
MIMSWIRDFHLFLFDFDGLLVDTEKVHFLAYQKMCEEQGFHLQWSFENYIKIAHYSSEGLEKQVYADFPGLKEKQPDWSILYKEKRRILLDLYREGAVQLMPGVIRLLKLLEENKICRAVVTHSDDEQIRLIKKIHPVLTSIPHWITRYEYQKPKPDPECYQAAINKLAKTNDQVIGFEDSPRGLKALMGTKAKPVLVNTIEYPESTNLRKQGVLILKSLEELFGVGNGN